MIEVLFFSYLRDEVGQETIQIEQDQMSIKDIKEFILQNYHVKSLDSVMIAVNEEYAMDTTMVKAGDKVALIPPVSGG
jgi:molybdopterin synthase sulfur carrier subunit